MVSDRFVELSDPKITYSLLFTLSEKREQIPLQKKEIRRSIGLSPDKFGESLKLLNFFDIIVNEHNCFYITKYGKEVIPLIINNVNIAELHPISYLYRLLPTVKKMISSFISKYDILSYHLKFADLAKVLNKEDYWIHKHLRELNLIVYSSKKKNAVFTDYGKEIFTIFIVEAAIKKYGRDKFRKKLSIDLDLKKQIIDHIQRRKNLLELLYPEAITVMSLLANQILKGGVELLDHHDVIKFRNYVMRFYEPSKNARIALFLPCAKGKPFSTSRTHKRVRKYLDSLSEVTDLNVGKLIEEFIISEPIGVVPRKYEMFYPAASYDMTLDTWIPLDTMNENGQTKYVSQFFSSVQTMKNGKASKSKKITNTIINKLSDEISIFLSRYSKQFEILVAYVRSTHRIMLEKAAKKANVNIIFIPTDNEIRKLKNYYGPVSWSLRGMRNAKTLQILSNQLLSILSLNEKTDN